MEELYGFVENIIFAGEGFTVARLKEPRKADLTSIVGAMPALQPGETLRCKGAWEHHPQHGRQFRVHSFESHQPSDLIGIQKYLESGMIKGIGPVYAERIVKKFGLETLKIIDELPKRLLEVDGIGSKRVSLIETCWKQQRSIRDVMIFLRSHGVSPAFAQKIYKTYGEASIEKVKSDPFALAKEIHGIGFKIADGIAKGLGMPPDCEARIDAGIEHVLWELSNDGHTCFPQDELKIEAANILQVELLRVGERIEALVKNGQLVKETPLVLGQENIHRYLHSDFSVEQSAECDGNLNESCRARAQSSTGKDGSKICKYFLDRALVWVKPLYLAETGIVRELKRLEQISAVLRKVDVEKALAWVQTQLKIELAIEQKEAVASAIQEKVLIITGGPGTGKSTITKAILKITEKLTGKIILAAPTGRAAKRMSEITGKKASTIHMLLEVDFQAGGFKKNRDNPLDCALIIVDEASMIDTFLMYSLLKAIPSTARLIFIGDVDQLPSVGPGNVLKDLIESGKICMSRLSQIFRQAAGSRIVTNAHRINLGEFPDLSYQPKSDFRFIAGETPEEILKIIVDLIAYELPKSHHFHRFHDIQLLCPMKRGIIGTENLNIVFQQRLNPSPTPLSRMGRTFHVGDKVMQVRNNYQKLVFNGDVGKITAIDLSEQTITAAFDERLISYEFSEIDELVLAYAVSIHKYQGSECPCVIIPVHTTHFKLLHKNLLYTGITRGKKLVILVGTKKALAIALHNNEVEKRHTGLLGMFKLQV